MRKSVWQGLLVSLFLSFEIIVHTTRCSRDNLHVGIQYSILTHRTASGLYIRQLLWCYSSIHKKSLRKYKVSGMWNCAI
ncbi:hypothetical protein BDR03DRAFT_954074 [Suillus americanus]|nr:hypothetical protein BDR03DRAFT_954074 [Suillus americanus]